MEAATTDRIQRMIDAEAAERFPPGAVPRLVLLRYGDHPVIEPGELYLLVIPGQDGATRDAWMAEHFDRLEDFRARRLPEVKGFMVTTGARDSAGLPPTRIMQMDGISLLDPEEDEIARGLTQVPEALLGPVDLATLDTLITAGIAASRAEAARWALARIREQPAHAQLSGRRAGARRAPGAGSPGPGRARPAANQARRAGEGAFPRRRGAADRAAAARRRPVGRAGRPAGPGIHRRGRGKPEPAGLAPGPRDDDRRASARARTSSFPAPATSSCGSARTAARARAGTGSVPRQTIQPAASRISPRLTSGSDPWTWRCWTR